MTTTTPTDQPVREAGTAVSGIPAQRTGRTIRLLVLGTEPTTDALRELAIASTVEIAQRFSSRVTHVVADGSVNVDDPRLVRARSAGVPVIDVAEGLTVLEPAVSPDPDPDPDPDIAGADEDASGTGIADEPTAMPEADRPDHQEADEGVGGAETTDGPVSVLEASLVFPPLPPEVLADAGDSAVRYASSADQGGDEYPDELPVAAVCMEPATATFGSATVDESIADAGGDDLAPSVAGAGDRNLPEDSAYLGESRLTLASDSSGTESAEIAAADPDMTTAVSPAGVHGTASATAVSLAWAIVPLVSLGLLTPVSMGYAAYRLRSRGLVVATAWYAVAVSIAFAVSASAPAASSAAARHGATDGGGLLTACLAASWAGGTLHSFFIRRRVFH